jgi:hypothetical protein
LERRQPWAEKKSNWLGCEKSPVDDVVAQLSLKENGLEKQKQKVVSGLPKIETAFF